MTNGALAPFSQEAEEAVIGAVMVNPDALLAVATYLKPKDFYILRHVYIWDCLLSLSKTQVAIDFVTVVDGMRAAGHLDDIGGPGYLLRLVNSTPNSTHADVYGKLVYRTAIRRRMLDHADLVTKLAFDEAVSVDKALFDGEKSWMDVKASKLDDRRESFADMIDRMMTNVQERMEHPDQPVGLATGFRDLDDATSGGLRRGKLYILAARPGMGKTSMLMSVSLNAAKLGGRIGIASQEMNRDEIVERFAALETGINLQKINMGRLTDDEYTRFVKACGILGKLKIEVDDANRLTPMDLRAKCLRWENEMGLDLLVVDYLQILSSGGAFSPNQRTQEVGFFAREMKQIAREFNVPVYCAAQLNRASEGRNDHRPGLSDLRESGEIEQEADVVEFIYRDVVYNEATEFPNRADIIIAKHRNGPTGTISLNFERQTTKFSDATTTTIDLSRL
jgi:replicative DNA helicase